MKNYEIIDKNQWDNLSGWTIDELKSQGIDYLIIVNTDDTFNCIVNIALHY